MVYQSNKKGTATNPLTVELVLHFQGLRTPHLQATQGGVKEDVPVTVGVCVCVMHMSVKMVMVVMVSKAVTLFNKPPSEQGHDLFLLSLGRSCLSTTERRQDDIPY